MPNKRSLELLNQGKIPERYQRNIGTIGIEGQKRLLKSKAAIVGAGGLGGYITEMLARQGVGYLRIIDGDDFAEHNLNRQILATEKNLGKNKAVEAAKRVGEINSDVFAEAVSQMLDAENAVELLSGMDVIVDALDSIGCRLILSKTAKELNIPLVHGAIAGFIGQVTTLRPEKGGLGQIYKVTASSDKGVEVQLGTPAATPALAAALEVQETIKLLTGIGETLDEQLLYFDTEINIFEILKLS